MAWMFTRIPTAFLPDEDQGILFAQIQTPSGATAERTKAVIDEATKYLLEEEKDAVTSVFAVNGFNFGGRGQNASILFIKLRDWDERGAASLKARAVAARANAHFRKTVRDAMLFVVPPPSVMELGNVTGFDFMLMDRAGVGHELLAARNQLLGAAAKSLVLQGVRPNGIEDAPQYQLDIDREKARALGVAVSDINSTLATAWGSSYVNDFIDRGRVKKVFVQGDASARMLPEDLEKWYVRNKNGDMVPFSAFSSASWTYGPQKLNRYNGSPSFNIQGQAAPGYSSGAAMQEMERLARSCRPAWATNGPACRSKSACRARRRRRSMRSR